MVRVESAETSPALFRTYISLEENPTEEDCSLSEATMYFRVSADGRGASTSTLLKNDDIIGASFIYPAATRAKIYVLDAFGGVHRGGSAPSLSPATPYFGFDAPMDIEFNAGETGYYVLDRFGGVHAEGAPQRQAKWLFSPAD